MRERVLIAGAGVAGLAAGERLARAGWDVTVVEARSRCGGRVHTIGQFAEAPIELGAEFYHGNPPELEELGREYRLARQIVADEHWRVQRGQFVRLETFWDALAEVFEHIPAKGPDRPYADFIGALRSAPEEAKRLATDFVEGFHAADPHRIGVRSIAESESASEEVDGQKQFRLVAGYAELIRAMAAGAVARGACIRLDHAITRIAWKPGSATVTARHGEQVVRFECERVVITLPLGVLQARAVQFDPPLLAKEQPLRQLAMGNAVKVNLQVRPGLWPGDKDGFIHLASERFPTWWKHRDVVTAWAGGPKADALAKASPVEVLNAAFESLADIFGVDASVARQHVLSAQYHDWRNDPFTRGAYSYVPAGAAAARNMLARPLKQTLFFAGEATARSGFQGTVHGAIESGFRAAREVMKNRSGTR